MKQVCRECHFLSKIFPLGTDHRTMTDTLTEAERDKIKIGDDSFLGKGKSLKCFQGFFKTEVGEPDKKERLKIVNEIDRKECNRFLTFMGDGVSFQAATDSQDSKQSKKQFSITTAVAIAAVLIALFVLFLK